MDPVDRKKGLRELTQLTQEYGGYDAEDDDMPKPISITFDSDARVKLEKLQAETGAEDLVTLVRRALGLYEWAIERRKLGHRIGCYNDDQIIAEIKLDGFK